MATLFQRIRLLFLCCTLGLMAVGCTPVGALVGAGAVAGTTALQERGFNQAITDTGIEATILSELADQNFETFQRVGVTVVEGRVLLTGVVPNAQDRISVVQTSWRTNGVTEVINELLIGEDVGLINTGFDVKIAKQLELNLTLDNEVKSVNYIGKASGGTLFIMGIAQTQAELDRVLAHARDVERVRRIISHVQLKDSAERQAILTRLEEMAEPSDEKDDENDTAEDAAEPAS